MTDEELLQKVTRLNNTSDFSFIDTQLARAKNDKGQTALHLIKTTSFNTLHFNDIIKTLVEFGANINALDNEGKTPLHYSTTFDDIFLNSRTPYLKNDNIRFLLKNGANPNITDKQGNSPLDNIINQSIILMSVLENLILSGANLQLIKEGNWRSLRETLLKEIGGNRTAIFLTQLEYGETARMLHNIPSDRTTLVLKFFEGGRRMTVEDLPLLQKEFTSILNTGQRMLESQNRPLSSVLYFRNKPFGIEGHRYALIQLKELFDKSNIENKAEYINKIEEQQKKILSVAINSVRNHSNDILSMPLAHKERYINILSELCSQTTDPKIHKLYEILPKVCIDKKRIDAMQQNETDKLEKLDQGLFTHLNKEANPENPHSTTQVFNDPNTRSKVTKYLKLEDLANLNIAIPVRSVPTSDELSQKIDKLRIAKDSTSHAAKEKNRQTKPSPRKRG
ncbi:ankyrin repeat domain-containing protein [Candidatus Phycorickettsia trachydisci]|nr:ankyrin repeat domain-containing protein [Candidatus Phycorickettsia trachydisci]